MSTIPSEDGGCASMSLLGCCLMAAALVVTALVCLLVGYGVVR